MHKRAYMHTMEAFIAVMITFVFLIYVVPQFQGNEGRREGIDVMGSMLKDDSFRDCVLKDQISEAEVCAAEILSNEMPQTYAFKVEISNSREFEAFGLPDKRVFTESVMLAGNMTLYSPRYVRLYYWFP